MSDDLRREEQQLDIEQALLNQRKRELAEQKLQALEVEHQALVAECRAAKDGKEQAAREMEESKRGFIRALGTFDNASVHLANHHEKKPHYSDYPSREELEAWESQRVDLLAEVQRAEREYSEASTFYNVKRAEWHRIRDKFQILADRESEMRSRLTPNRPRNGFEVTYGSGRTAILARG